jgi:RecA-family ATPase
MTPKEKLDAIKKKAEEQRPVLDNDELLDIWDLRGPACDIESMVHYILHFIEGREPYGLIVLDPTYKLLGDRDENAGGEMTKLCSHLELLAQESGAAVVAATHFPKGAMGARISRGSNRRFRCLRPRCGRHSNDDSA